MSSIHDLFDDLKKMDPALAQALANIRAGKGTAADANLLARGMYTDTMVPKMGNKLAYNDFLGRNGNRGIHVHVDMNDFGQINKHHGERMGDHAIKQFGAAASEVSRMFGGKAFRNGGDEFKFWFHKPEHAMGFARELRSRLEKHPKVGGTHNLAASMGIGFNPDHAENALLEAKKQLGPTINGKRQNLHSVGNAPTVIHSKAHEAPPEGWKPSTFTPPPKQTKQLTPPGLKFHNPLAKNHPGDAPLIHQPIPPEHHPVFTGGKFGIVTADAPRHPVSTPGGNVALEKELRSKGLKYEKITGKYDDPNVTENSFIVHDVSPKALVDLGRRYGQDSVIHSYGGTHKYIYTNGENAGAYHEGTGHMVHAVEPQLLYSTLRHNGQPIHFTLNFDFDHLYNASPLKKALPPPKFPLEDEARAYASHAGMAYEPSWHGPADEALMQRAAHTYEALPHTPNDPQVQAAYDALKRETLQQYHFLKSRGYQFSVVPGNATPYQFPEKPFDVHCDARFQYVNDHGDPINAGEIPYDSNFENLYGDILNNKSLKVFTGGHPPPDHPLAEKLPFEDPLGTYNNLFRAVHDIFGHGLGVERYRAHNPNQNEISLDFGHHGEEHAYRAQASMYSPLARKALATETRGQNAAFHFGPNGAANRANPARATYPDQKAALMPDEFVHHSLKAPAATPSPKAPTAPAGSAGHAESDWRLM